MGDDIEACFPSGIQSIIIHYVIDMKFSEVAKSLKYDKIDVEWYYLRLSIQKELHNINYLIDFIDLFSNNCAAGNLSLCVWIYYRMIEIDELRYTRYLWSI